MSNLSALTVVIIVTVLLILCTLTQTVCTLIHAHEFTESSPEQAPLMPRPDTNYAHAQQKPDGHVPSFLDQFSCGADSSESSAAVNFRSLHLHLALKMEKISKVISVLEEAADMLKSDHSNSE